MIKINLVGCCFNFENLTLIFFYVFSLDPQMCYRGDSVIERGVTKKKQIRVPNNKKKKEKGKGKANNSEGAESEM